jgi:catechol 2,3-dioxygenase-like lactoylglutathione lyase family enzyme
VRFTDPDGFPVEVVHGRDPLPPLPAETRVPPNLGSERHRFGDLVRLERGPARLKRLGHAVLRVGDFRRSEAWYREHFGFLASDQVYVGDERNVVTSFMRCDRGGEFTDHHTFLCIGTGQPAFDHAAFEVEDMDAVMVGHDHLAAKGYEHHAGVGRHVLGSQVFDYWRDPWGHVLEHFTDGDLLNASHEEGLHDPATALGTQWGKFAP